MLNFLNLYGKKTKKSHQPLLQDEKEATKKILDHVTNIENALNKIAANLKKKKHIVAELKQYTTAINAFTKACATMTHDDLTNIEIRERLAIVLKLRPEIIESSYANAILMPLILAIQQSKFEPSQPRSSSPAFL